MIKFNQNEQIIDTLFNYFKYTLIAWKVLEVSMSHRALNGKIGIGLGVTFGTFAGGAVVVVAFVVVVVVALVVGIVASGFMVTSSSSSSGALVGTTT